jgi:hypothetical protein
VNVSITRYGVPFNSTDNPDFEVERRTVDEIQDKLRESDYPENPQ